MRSYSICIVLIVLWLVQIAAGFLAMKQKLTTISTNSRTSTIRRIVPTQQQRKQQRQRDIHELFLSSTELLVNDNINCTSPNKKNQPIQIHGQQQQQQEQQQEKREEYATAETNNKLTSAILRVSFDGDRFSGWTSSNYATEQDRQGRQTLDYFDGDNKNNHDIHNVLFRSRRRRHRRNLKFGIFEPSDDNDEEEKTFVRPVDGALQQNLAKIYGNIDPNRIVVEGCSRTDRGVHAKAMFVHIYCLKEGILEAMEDEEGNNFETATTTTKETTATEQTDNEQGEGRVKNTIYRSIPGKRKPHPNSPTDDSYFIPLPMGGNLSRIAFALNRMRPDDVKITGIAPFPSGATLPNSNNEGTSASTTTTIVKQPFHVSLNSISKTYEYRIAIGPFHDPTIRRMVWYVGNKQQDCNLRHRLDISKMEHACQIVQGRHDFIAFQASSSSSSSRTVTRKNRSSHCTYCNLSVVKLEKVEPPIQGIYYSGVDPPIEQYKFTITGDRFLYRMVRLLVGSIVAVGTGRLQLEDIERALLVGNWYESGKEAEAEEEITASSGGRRRRKEFECAPSHGLLLKDINYGDTVNFDWQPLRCDGARKKIRKPKQKTEKIIIRNE